MGQHRLKLSLALAISGLCTVPLQAQTVPGGGDLDLRSQAFDYCAEFLGTTMTPDDFKGCVNGKYSQLMREKYGPHNGPGGAQGPMPFPGPVWNCDVSGCYPT